MQNGSLKPGVLLAFTLYQSQLQSELLNLMNSYTSLIKSSGAGEKVFALLDRHVLAHVPALGTDGLIAQHTPSFNNSADSATAAECESSLTCLRFENVSFAYPSRPDVLVLKDFNLELQSGKTIALIGKSGCGTNHGLSSLLLLNATLLSDLQAKARSYVLQQTI